MTSRRRLTEGEARILTDMIEFSQVAARLVARGRDSYDGDEMLPLAAEAILLKMGEAVARLPESVMGAHPNVRWRSMRGLRNLVAHEYEVVDPNIIWNTLAQELPSDAEAIQRILADGWVVVLE